MTATEQATEPTGYEGHVSDAEYVKIALILGLLTAIEVGTYFESVHKAPDWLLILVLSTLMVVKFVMVAAYFMHLKYDDAIFTKFIATGLVLAYPVYGIFAFAMGWLPDWHWFAKVSLLVVPPVLTAAVFLFAWQGGNHDHDDAAH
jgi:cytochrome c oxidase subunit 4